MEAYFLLGVLGNHIFCSPIQSALHSDNVILSPMLYLLGSENWRERCTTVEVKGERRLSLFSFGLHWKGRLRAWIRLEGFFNSTWPWWVDRFLTQPMWVESISWLLSACFIPYKKFEVWIIFYYFFLINYYVKIYIICLNYILKL